MRQRLAMGLALVGFVHAWAGFASMASADLPAGVRYDDGFAYFKAVNRNSITNNVPSEAWYLEANARLLGPGIAEGSAFKFVLKKGRRTIGQTVCEGLSTWGYRREPGHPPDNYSIAGCADLEQRLDDVGVMQVEVRLIDDMTDEETLLRTHTIDVRKVKRERATGQPSPSEFFVNQHAEAAAMLIEQVEFQHHPMFSALNGRTGSAAAKNQVRLHVMRSPSDRFFQMTMRCTVDGERVDLGQDDNVVVLDGRPLRQTVNQVLRVPGRNNTQADQLSWESETLLLPLTFGEGEGAEYTPYINMRAHPGRWECFLRRPDRKKLRVFAFTLGADGLIAPHPEERAGLSLPPGVHLLDGTIPDDSPVDGRTDPSAARAGAFFGRPWATPEGRAIGARIPAIGDPYPSSAARRPR